MAVSKAELPKVDVINELTAWIANLSQAQAAFFLGSLSGYFRNNPDFWQMVAAVKKDIGPGLKPTGETAAR